MPSVKRHSFEPGPIISEMLGKHISAQTQINGGRNSQVYRVDCEDSQSYVAKFYPPNQKNGRDRLNIEFTSLKFLWDHGVRSIPKPIVSDPSRRCSIFEYVAGKMISTTQLTGIDIDDAVSFLLMLKDLGHDITGSRLPPAAEACFSISAVMDSIDTRLTPLLDVQRDRVEQEALREFLTEDYSSSLAEIKRWCTSTADELGIGLETPLEPCERTLNPSDFGFHNALVKPDGQMVFLDFEYFGWDDPAKMISDFLLHPAMELDARSRQRFLSGILAGFNDPQLADRIAVVYPLFGLKWCLILLNEFLPDRVERRTDASVKPLDIGDLQTGQLIKAKRMLQKINSEYQTFQHELSHCR